jgi:proline racemase
VVNTLLAASAAAAVAAMVTACAAEPLRRPMTGADVDTTAGSVEAVRRQLQGRWELVALESVPARGGARVPIKATGTLTYDEFGNLTIDARTTDPAAPVAARESDLLAFKGRAVIDAVHRELKLMDVTGNVDPDEVLSTQHRRRFEFDAGTLRLSSLDERGEVTTVATWRHVK